MNNAAYRITQTILNKVYRKHNLLDALKNKKLTQTEKEEFKQAIDNYNAIIECLLGILDERRWKNEQLKKYFWNYHIAVCGNSNVNFVTGSDADNVVEP